MLLLVCSDRFPPPHKLFRLFTVSSIPELLELACLVPIGSTKKERKKGTMVDWKKSRGALLCKTNQKKVILLIPNSTTYFLPRIVRIYSIHNINMIRCAVLYAASVFNFVSIVPVLFLSAAAGCDFAISLRLLYYVWFFLTLHALQNYWHYCCTPELFEP